MSFDAKVLRRVCDNLRQGGYRAAAAEAAGISERTLRNWMRWGREGREPYVAAVAAVKRAEREGEQELVACVRAAATEDWKAAMTLLERRHPARWGRHDRLTMGREEKPAADAVTDGQKLELARHYVANLEAKLARGAS